MQSFLNKIQVRRYQKQIKNFLIKIFWKISWEEVKKKGKLLCMQSKKFFF